LKEQLNDNGIEIPEDFIEKDTSLTYMRTFIQNIASVFPTIMMTKIDYDYPVPLSLIKVIRASRTHEQGLIKMMNKHYLNEIIKFSTDHINIREFLKDEEIGTMLERITLPVNESRIYEYEFYIYSIFLKYFDYGNATQILKFYITLFKQDKSNIFLSYDEIKRLTLKDRVLEANKIRLERNKMTSEDRYIFDFRQNQNIDENARLGRLRDYNAQHRDVEYELFGEDLRAEDLRGELGDSDIGNDGDRNDDGDDE
jgi:hypothetical protein